MMKQNPDASAKGTHLRPLSPMSDNRSANPFEITRTLDPEPNAEDYCQQTQDLHLADTVGVGGISLHSGHDELEKSHFLRER
jgi:hypothetical protein